MSTAEERREGKESKGKGRTEEPSKGKERRLLSSDFVVLWGRKRCSAAGEVTMTSGTDCVCVCQYTFICVCHCVSVCAAPGSVLVSHSDL